MTTGELAYFAAYLNTAVRWRFSWYWQTTLSRIRRLMIPNKAPSDMLFHVEQYMPALDPAVLRPRPMSFQQFALGDIYDLKAGDYHSLAVLPSGSVPVVSCGDAGNGISGHFDVKRHTYCSKLTIAFNGMNTLTAKYHPYTFAAKDDVAVCFSKRPLRLTTELFIQVMLSRERWRFSYYRKCYREKLERLTVSLPAKNGWIDEDAIQDVMKAAPYWGFLKRRLSG